MRSSRCASVELGEDRAGLGLEQLLVGRARVAGRVVVAHQSRVGRSAPRAAIAVGSPRWPGPRLHPPRRRRAPPPAARARRRPFARHAYDELSMARDRPRGRHLEGAAVPLLPEQAGLLRGDAGGEGRRARARVTTPTRRCRRSSSCAARSTPSWLGRGQPRGLRQARAQRRERSPRCASSSTACATPTSARILDGISPAAGAARAARGGPRAGCGSWTGRSSTGSSTRTSTATSSAGCCWHARSAP